MDAGDVERRWHKRVCLPGEMDLLLSVSSESRQSQFHAQMDNLSLNGCYIEDMNGYLQRGEVVTLYVQCEQFGDQPNQVTGRIVYHDERGAGVQFLMVPLALIEAIRSLVQGVYVHDQRGQLAQR